MARGKTPENETKRDKFLRLANARIDRIIRGLESLAKLSSAAYERTPDDVAKIEKAISAALKDACTKLGPRVAGAGKAKREAVL